MTISSKDINAHERLIFALDVPTFEDAKSVVDTLGEHVSFYKIGLEMLTNGRYFDVLNYLKDRQKRVFIDLKLHDVPNTVAAAVRNLRELGADFCTVHGGTDSILQAACEEKGSLKILAVTVLTSIDEKDLGEDVATVVMRRATGAKAVGCDGVIASGLEAQPLRQSLGDDFLIVVPGIRPSVNKARDDQKRTVDVEEAFERGADHIVVGRPIRTADDPAAAAADVQRRIAKHFGG